jgi:hypothetical protein
MANMENMGRETNGFLGYVSMDWEKGKIETGNHRFSH